MFSKPTSQRALFLLITILLFGATIAAQDTRKTQEDEATKLLAEGLQLVSEGSPASLTKAIEKLESARTSVHALNLPEGEGAALCLLAYAYDQLGQDQKAIEKYEESLPLFRAARSPKGEATALLHIGLVHAKLGEMQKALDTFNRALPLFRAADEPDGEMLVLSTMGSLLIFLGKPEEALNYYNQAFEIARTTGSRKSQAAAPTAIGPLSNVMDQPQQARDNLVQAVSLFRAMHFPRGEALALLTLGLAHSSDLETQKALEYYDQALPLFRAEHDRLGEGAALFGLCMSYVSLRDYQKWSDYCGQAETIQRATGDRQSESLTLKQIAIGELDRGNLAGSQAAIESAIAIIESLRTKVINPALRLSYFEGSQHYYEFYIDLLMRLHKQNPNGAYDGKALEASERARARSLLEILTEANADIRQGVDATLLQREREIQRRLNVGAETQMQLFSRPYSETQAKAIAEEIKKLIDDLQQVETEIRQKNPRYAALTQPRPLTLKEIQTQVLDPDTLLLEYSLGEKRSYVWAVTSSSSTSYELPKGDD
ncbi:MAG TPA: tetratricopeptide repeat protein, partial [Pyrinomonadaceae bacterium]|nr:tetratricopeptide repeat protein [Pyrinomonadaceae bacterium]